MRAINGLEGLSWQLMHPDVRFHVEDSCPNMNPVTWLATLSSMFDSELWSNRDPGSNSAHTEGTDTVR